MGWTEIGLIHYEVLSRMCTEVELCIKKSLCGPWFLGNQFLGTSFDRRLEIRGEERAGSYKES